jgi:hypothetical protein
MATAARQPGLAVVVRYGRREQRQVIASCDEPAKGNALGDVGGSILDIAACDGLYRLIHRSGYVVVERERGDAGVAAVSTIRLPSEIRIVRPELTP